MGLVGIDGWFDWYFFELVLFWVDYYCMVNVGVFSDCGCCDVLFWSGWCLVCVWFCLILELYLVICLKNVISYSVVEVNFGFMYLKE